MSFFQRLFKPNVTKLEAKGNIKGLIKALGHRGKGGVHQGCSVLKTLAK